VATVDGDAFVIVAMTHAAFESPDEGRLSRRRRRGL